MVNHKNDSLGRYYLELVDRNAPPIMYRSICSRSTLSKVGASVKAFDLVYWVLWFIDVHSLYDQNPCIATLNLYI